MKPVSSTGIHETALRDIIELLHDIKDSPDNWEKVLSGNRSKSFKSVASASSNLVAVFPVVCTRSITIQDASMVAKALERNYTSMMQMLFSAYQIDDVTNAAEYLSKFHKNIKLSGSPNVDDVMAIGAGLQSLIGENNLSIKPYLAAMKEDMRNLDYYLPGDISESSINSFKVSNGPMGMNVIREDFTDSDAKFALDKAKNDREAVSSKLKNAKDVADTMRVRQDILKNRMLDSDVKKANELMPTSVVISFYSKTDNSSPTRVTDAVIGIKCKLYPVSSDEIINRVKLKVSDRNGITELIRATTRETSFWKDFVFALDRAKIDALSTSRRGSTSKVWKVLERRALLSKFKRAAGSTNDASAITTLVVSQEEVEHIKTHENIDLENLSIVRPFMEALNLMGFVIVDESMEVAKFLFDTGDDMFETISFTHLERESNDNTYKRVVNLMTKVAR